ncbi:CGNR zinc finger domain-containing protein [Nocardia uniformis]|uniref:CGNR zinc finger domain-containing protein n=1 Tax=Nocardia uniformis TaxID=53432 RepID=A0A849BVN1_9NOCA|nr:CGNR zinc finger domain-containing protein [Nocardia uniformis]NNH69158.1 CGNR zinc finger domain-containing protein [Nocardia uniformis]
MLGTEPLAVELANTRYEDGGEVVDFLASPESMTGWFAELDAASSARVVPARDLSRLRELRDHIHAVLAALADGTHPGQESIEAVNDCAAQAHSSVRMDWPAAGAPRSVSDSSSTGTTRLLAELASETITLATDGSLLSRCAGTDCRMLFVRQHGRRRFCHSSCSQRARQARYQQRLASQWVDGKLV